MLPIVQRFPEERLVVVEATHGACVLVVWVHQVLGLTVLVKLYRDHGQRQYRFGEGPEQVIIHVGSIEEKLGKQMNTPHPVTLLSTSEGSRLFSLKTDIDDDPIESASRGPLSGYCKRVLRHVVGYQLQNEALIKELSLVAIAYAMLIAEHLHVRSNTAEGFFNNLSIKPFDEEFTSDPLMPCKISAQNIMEAAAVLFDDRKIKRTRVEEYVALNRSIPIYSFDQPRRTIYAILKELKSSSEGFSWRELNSTAIQISILILACAQISNKEACGGFPICEDIHIITQSSLFGKVTRWNGRDSIGIHEMTAFESIATLILRERLPKSQEHSICLLSSVGWSMFVSTFGDADPSFTGKTCKPPP